MRKFYKRHHEDWMFWGIYKIYMVRENILTEIILLYIYIFVYIKYYLIILFILNIITIIIIILYYIILQYLHICLY